MASHFALLPDSTTIDSRNTPAAFIGEAKISLPFMIRKAAIRTILEDYRKFITGAKKKRDVPGDRLYNLRSNSGEKKNIIRQHPRSPKNSPPCSKKSNPKPQALVQ